MAKYDVKFSCGHTHTVELFGKMSERERKIKYLEECGVCPECREREKAVDCEEVEMHYSEYKNNYSDCKTKAGSYNAKTKTITVYVPKNNTVTEIKKSAEKEAIKEIAEIVEIELNSDNYDKVAAKCKKIINTPLLELEKIVETSSENKDEIKKAKNADILKVAIKYKKIIGEI